MAAPSGIQFQQTDTTPSWSQCGINTYCATSTILANRYAHTVALIGGATGASNNALQFSVSGSNQRAYWVELFPDDYIEPRAGDWTCELYVVTGNSNVKLSKVFVCHVGTIFTFPPTTCAHRGTFGSATPNITLSSSGVTHQVTVTGSAMANWTPGDSRVAVVFCFENTAGSTQSITVRNRGSIYMPGIYAFRPGTSIPDADARVIHPRFQNVPTAGVVQPGGGVAGGPGDGFPDDVDPDDDFDTFLGGRYVSQTRPDEYTHPDRRLWSTKRCGVTLFKAWTLGADDVSAGEEHKVGLRRPITAHPVRAEQRLGSGWAHEEHCKFHYGRVLRGPGGMKKLVHCYQPDRRDRAYGIGAAFRGRPQDDENVDPSTGEPWVHPGRTVAATMMRLPQTYPATYYGPAIACAPPV